MKRHRTLVLPAAVLLLVAPAGLSAQDPFNFNFAPYVDLKEGFAPDPYVAQVEAIGTFEAASFGCEVGYVDLLSTFEVNYDGGGGAAVYIYAESQTDLVLDVDVFKDDGTDEQYCSDDHKGTNPMVRIPDPGPLALIAINVGTFAEGEAPAVLYISRSDPSVGRQ